MRNKLINLIKKVESSIPNLPHSWGIVGGCVRDTLMGLSINDIDVVVENETIESMIDNGFKMIGKSFPVFIHPSSDKEHIEVALCRTERTTGTGHNSFQCNVESITFEEDLMRRDLTINAIVFTHDYKLIGSVDDLYNKILRHTSNAFKDDPLRVIRLARFGTKFNDFVIADDTIRLVKGMRESIKSISRERINMEINKALSYDEPSRFFKLCNEFEVLDIVLPPLYECIGINTHQEEDLFEHLLMVLDESSKMTNDISVRLASLLYDIGKPLSLKINELKMLKFTNKQIRIIEMGMLHHNTIHDFIKLEPCVIAKRFVDKKFPNNLNELEQLLIISKSAKQHLSNNCDYKFNLIRACFTNITAKINIDDAWLENPHTIPIKLHHIRCNIIKQTIKDYDDNEF